MTKDEFQEKYGYAPLANALPTQTTLQEPTEPTQTLTDNTLTRFAGGIVAPFGRIGERVLEPVAKGLSKLTGQDIKAPTTYREFEPETTAGKIGEFVGEVSQFAIPGGAVTRATKGLGLATRAITEGVTSGGVAMLQTGEIDKDTRDIAILSAIFPVAGGAIKSARVKLGQKAAPRVINSLIKPLKKDMSYGKNPGRAVAQEGIIANSLDDLENKIGEKLGTRLTQLESKLGVSKATFDLSKTLGPLDEAMGKAVKQNNSALVTRLEKAKQALTQNLVREVSEETGETVITSAGAKNLKNISAKEATNFKREIGELTAFTGNPSDDKLVNSALKRVYGNVKGNINAKVPGAETLNERIADLISAKIATKYRGEIMERQNLISFTPKVVGGVGLASSLLTGNPIPVIVGLGIAGFEKALETPKAKTSLASWLAGATTEQKKQLFQKAPWAKGVIQRMLISED